MALWAAAFSSLSFPLGSEFLPSLKQVPGLGLGAGDPYTHFCFCLVISSVLGRQFVHGSDP